MAVTKCAADIAANIAPNCEKPITHGYTGRGVIYNRMEVDFTPSATNPRKITAIAPREGKKPYLITNVGTNPFDGTNKAQNLEGNAPRFNKTIAFDVPLRGADVSKDIIEPLLKNRGGFVLLLELNDRVGDGSFEIYGYESGAKCTALTENPTDVATGGSWHVELMEEAANFGSVVLFDTDYETSLSSFEAQLLLADV